MGKKEERIIVEQALQELYGRSIDFANSLYGPSATLAEKEADDAYAILRAALGITKKETK